MLFSGLHLRAYTHARRTRKNLADAEAIIIFAVPPIIQEIAIRRTAAMHEARIGTAIIWKTRDAKAAVRRIAIRSEEHTSELQSRPHLVCRLRLEKKKTGRRGAVA